MHPHEMPWPLVNRTAVAGDSSNSSSVVRMWSPLSLSLSSFFFFSQSCPPLLWVFNQGGEPSIILSVFILHQATLGLNEWQQRKRLGNDVLIFELRHLFISYTWDEVLHDASSSWKWKVISIDSDRFSRVFIQYCTRLQSSWAFVAQAVIMQFP